MIFKRNKSLYKPIGKYIRLVDNRNKDLSITNLLGINITKNFMPSVANVSGTDLSKYKIIRKGQFAYSAMQVGRDETIRVALFTDYEPAIISPAYLVFEVIDEKEILPEFIMMWFQRAESDRYGWFFSDSSVRASLEWERFCEIEIPIPDIKIQEKYVAIYKALLANQKAYEKSLDDLQIVCNSFLDELIQYPRIEPIGDHIVLTDTKNVDGKIHKLLGVNILKDFIPSKANVSKSSLLRYKIIKHGDFAANIMHVGRDEMLPVSLYQGKEPAIVSPAYKTFRLRNESELLSEFLMLLFHRPQFDSLTWYYCDSSVRGGLEWDRFCEIKIPVPSIEIQKTIITIYHTLETRKRINEKLKSMIKPLCPVLLKGVAEEMGEV